MRSERPAPEGRARRGFAAGVPSLLLVLVALALGLPGSAAAQYEKPPPASAYVLEGVSVVRADGSRIEGATLVVRDGKIAALGREVGTPAGARLLEGDSMTVYPGMIDGAGKAAYELPEPDTSPEAVPAWSPPRDVQGFRPRLRVADHLTSSGASVSGQRAEGVVAAAVHPEDGPMPGRSALLHLRERADVPRELVLDPALGAVLTLEPADDVYPSTLFGVMAFHRQEFRNARHHGRRAEAFREDPAGLRPPTWDPDYRVLSAVASGETPVFFRANTSNDIRRALDLAAFAGFDPVILGGREAWKVADLLARRNVPVLATTDYPEPKRWDPGAADSVDADTLPPAVQREKRRIENAYRNAARLEEAGVTFALTTGGGESDLREGVRTATEYGLSEEAALEAVTSAPADILGRPSLARLRPGVPANFVVADGPLFEEDTDLLYTFVDGRPQVMRPDPGSEPEEPPAVDVTGTWSVELSTDQGSFEGTMQLKQDESRVTGSFSSAGRGPPLSVEEGVVSGSELELTLTGSADGESIEITLSGTVEGDEASGTGSGPYGSFTWEATRTSSPSGGSE